MDVLHAADDEPVERVMEYACHEGNRALENMLGAARAEERAGRERSSSSR